MLMLQPLSVETIWGSTRLYDFGGDRSMGKIGQLYTVAAQWNYSNVVCNGEYAGRTLREVFEKNRSAFGCVNEFPLLIGLVDAGDNLSIQVHPTDAYAREALGLPHGKAESWIFLTPPASGHICNGTTCGSTEELRERIAQTRVMDAVDTLDVRRDDYVYVEAGTIHALTAGSLVYEIQQSTDITYRFYDYDRVDGNGCARPLHVKEALSVIEPRLKSISVPCGEGAHRERAYSVQTSKLSGFWRNDSPMFAAVTVLEGTVRCADIELLPGMSLIALPGEPLELEGGARCVVARPEEDER